MGSNNKDKKDESSFDKILFPVVKQVFAKTISNDLIFASKEEIEDVKNKFKQEVRNEKIDALLDDKDFKERNIEDYEDFKKLVSNSVKPMSAPKGGLMYMDYKYGGDK